MFDITTSYTEGKSISQTNGETNINVNESLKRQS